VFPAAWLVPALVVAAAALLSIGKADVAGAVQPINFTRGTVAGAGFGTSFPTSIAVGPEGRLYVSDRDGRVQALTLDPNTKQVTAVQQLSTSNSASGGLLEVYGIAFDPNDASSPPPVYVTNTISGFGDEGQAPPGSFPGKITKISGPSYGTKTDVITGLPVANSGHEANGLAFGPDGRLYIAQGGTTNAGVVNTGGALFQREEVPTGSAILVADIKAPGFNGNITYSPPNTYSTAVAKTGGDVNLYAVGFRNPYDIVFHTNGRLYNTDNGPNSGFGNGSQTCSTDDGITAQAPDELNIVVPGKYYGHPNRNRGINTPDPLQCDYKAGTEPSSGNYVAPIGLLPASSDGLAEYKFGGFGGQMQGDLLYVSWVENTLHRVKLSADGSSVVSDTTLATNLSNALDVTVSADGTIFVAEYSTNRITFFKPDETPVNSISVDSIFPAGGPISGGQPVTITGTNFTTAADSTVTIGGVALSNVVVQNSTTITGVTGANTAGLKDVTVTNSVGTDTLPQGYNYTTGGGALPPVANAGSDWTGPIAHNDHAHVTLDGRGSTDPDGFIQTYEWRENGVLLTTNPVDSIQFTLGEHLVTLTVTDNDGNQDTDDVRVIVTQFAENPEPYFCFDVNGDTAVNAIDLGLVAASFGKNYANNNQQGTNGYYRMRDWNADRSINAIDLAGTAQDFTASCPQVDREIRQATVYMEQFQNVNAAIAANYFQVTPYIPGQGRHMVLNASYPNDTLFEPGRPESLLYEPCTGTGTGCVNGWRLGGAMYIIPIMLEPLPPDGFSTIDDAWHYHNGLCIWNNGNAVQENTTQSDCLSRSGNPNWSEKAGWLVHLWNYVPNPNGRFVEVNPNF
jgi:glucose/arabinose dehydrogenase